MNGIEERYEFTNGWSIVVHTVTAEQVFFQRWPPNVDRQSFVANLARMPIGEFLKQVQAAEADHA